MKKINNCNHIGIFTNNPLRLIHFYRKIGGFKRVSEEILPAQTVRQIFGLNEKCLFIKLLKDDLVIELFKPVRSVLTRKNRVLGYNHFGICVANKEKYVSFLKSNGVKVIVIKRNKHNVYFMVDPDGNRIEIRE